jgi:putative membrane protein
MYGRGMIGNYGCFGQGFFGGGWSSLITRGVIIAAIVLIVYIVRRSNTTQANNPALDSLKIRLVQGEITEEEFLKKKAVLNKK